MSTVRCWLPLLLSAFSLSWSPLCSRKQHSVPTCSRPNPNEVAHEYQSLEPSPFFPVTYLRPYSILHVKLHVFLYLYVHFFIGSFSYLWPNTSLSNNRTPWSLIRDLFACINVCSRGAVKTLGGLAGVYMPPLPAPRALLDRSSKKKKTRLRRLPRLHSPTLAHTPSKRSRFIALLLTCNSHILHLPPPHSSPPPPSPCPLPWLVITPPSFQYSLRHQYRIFQITSHVPHKCIGCPPSPPLDHRMARPSHRRF